MAEDEGAKLTAEAFASTLKARQLQCRDMGHDWRPLTVRVLVARGNVRGYERTMRCKSCGTRRRQLLDSRGGVLRNGYEYADGYVASNVQKGFGREPFRLEALARWVDNHPEATEQEQVEE